MDTNRRGTDKGGDVGRNPTLHQVLEIFLYLGLAPYESFYFRNVDGVRSRGFDDAIAALNWESICTTAPPVLAGGALDSKLFVVADRACTDIPAAEWKRSGRVVRSAIRTRYPC